MLPKVLPPMMKTRTADPVTRVRLFLLSFSLNNLSFSASTTPRERIAEKEASPFISSSSRLLPLKVWTLRTLSGGLGGTGGGGAPASGFVASLASGFLASLASGFLASLASGFLGPASGALAGGLGLGGSGGFFVQVSTLTVK